jgi:hypothetical protein
MASPQKKKIILALIAGLATGGLGAGLIAGFVSYVVLNLEEGRLQRGWNLVPAVVAARDIAPGEEVAFAAMAQRSVPEQFITSSVVKPDSAAYVQNQVAVAPLNAGDPLYWGFFLTTRQSPGPGPASRGDPEVWAACDAALAASPAMPRRERTPADIRARLMREERR